METQKILKPVGRIVIVSDYREKEIINYLQKLGAIINQMNLEIGDFICSDRVAIERKTHSDFIGSIIDGRAFEQASDLKKSFEKPMIIVEGHSNREINENALKAATASLLIDYNISLVNTKNPFDTAKTIYWIAKKEQQESKYSVSFKVGKKPKDTKRLQEEIVASLPNVSTIISKRLLEHFGSIDKIFTADEDELKKVKGVGKRLATRIKKTLTVKYN